MKKVNSLEGQIESLSHQLFKDIKNQITNREKNIKMKKE